MLAALAQCCQCFGARRPDSGHAYESIADSDGGALGREGVRVGVGVGGGLDVEGELGSLNAEERAAMSVVRETAERVRGRGEEDGDGASFFIARPVVRAFSLLSHSQNIVAQRIAAQLLAELTERDPPPVVNSIIVDCGVFLLSSNDPLVTKAAAAALGNLAVEANNQTLIVMRGALDTLIKIMAASSAAPLNTESCEILCNAVGCLTNLATNDDNKDKIARSGALLPLTELALSDDLRVQRNATGAILNMTHSAENRMHLVAAGAVPVLVRLLNSPDYDVQYYSTTSLSNIAVDSNHRKLLAATEISVTNNLIRLTDSPSLKVQCQATLALRNLASDDFFQLEIVKYNGLTSLHHLLQSRIPQIVLAAVACIRNISIHPANESPIVAANFLPPLLDLLSIDNHEIQCHTMSTIRNLASSDENKRKIFEAGAVEKMAELLRLKDGILDDAVKSEMTACLSILALLDEVKPTLYKSIKYLIRLATTARNMDVKTNAAIAIGNAATNLEDATGVAVFLKYWKDIRKYIVEFLSSSDASLRHIAVWTLVQFVHGNDQLKMKVASDQQLVQVIRDIARELFLEEDASIAGNSLLAGASSAEELSQTLLLELGHS